MTGQEFIERFKLSIEIIPISERKDGLGLGGNDYNIVLKKERSPTSVMLIEFSTGKGYKGTIDAFMVLSSIQSDCLTDDDLELHEFLWEYGYIDSKKGLKTGILAWKTVQSLKEDTKKFFGSDYDTFRYDVEF